MGKLNLKWLAKQVGAEIYNHRADIAFYTGTAMVAIGTGMAISKAEEAVEVKRVMKCKIEAIEMKDETDSWQDGERARACIDMAKHTIGGYAKVYGPAIGVEGVGIALQCVSHKSLKNQVGTLAASLATNMAAFAQYRQRVRDELGEEKDEEFYMGKPVVEVKVDEKTGEQYTTTDLPMAPPHTFLFDETNPNWENYGFANRDFLENHLRWLNQKLQREGVLFENDIRRDVGAPIDPESTNWGITAVDDDGNQQYISFGMEKNTERAQAFRDGAEKSFWISLNMEPDISHKMYRLNKYHRDQAINGVTVFDNVTKKFKKI